MIFIDLIFADFALLYICTQRMYEHHRCSNGINPYVFIVYNKIPWGIGCATLRFTAYKVALLYWQ